MIWQLHWWFSNKYFNVRSMLFYSVKAIGIHHQHHKTINMKFVRFTKIICVRNSWCIVRTLNALMHALNALMHAWMRMRCSLREYACDAACVDAHAMQFTWMRMRCSLRECAYDAVCVDAHAMQPAWMRMRYSLREYACDAVCVNAHAMQSACLLNQLNQLNHHYLIQMIIIGSKWSC